jgi:hypothetical protein
MKELASFNNPNLLSIGQVANRKAFNIGLYILGMVALIGLIWWTLSSSVEEKEADKKPI